MTLRDLVKALQSRECRCGQPKDVRMCFCRRCYFKLPTETQNSLYTPIGPKLAEAYEHAIKELG